MSYKRSFDTGRLDSPRFRRLSPDARLLYLTLWFNKAAHMSGLYAITPEEMGLYAGLSSERTRDALIELQDHPALAQYAPVSGVVWVCDMMEDQGRGPKVGLGVQAQIAQLAKNCGLPRALLADFLARYSDSLKIKEEWVRLRCGSDTPSIPYQYPTDGVPNTAIDSVLDLALEVQGVAGGPSPAPAPPAQQILIGGDSPAPAPAPPAQPALMAVPEKRPRKAVKAPKAPTPTSATWDAYSAAYAQRYGTRPVRNAMINGQLANLVARLGAEEAPQVAAFFVQHASAFYANRGHAVGLLLADAEKLRTEWATGQDVGVDTPTPAPPPEEPPRSVLTPEEEAEADIVMRVGLLKYLHRTRNRTVPYTEPEQGDAEVEAR